MNLRTKNSGLSPMRTHQHLDPTNVVQDSSADSPKVDAPEVTARPKRTAETARASRAMAQNDLTAQHIRSRVEGPSAHVLPEEGFATIPGRGLTFTGTEGDDHYTVRQDGFAGDLTITNESTGRVFSIGVEEIEGLNIDTRGGNDTLRFADGILNRMKIDLGDGNDKVRYDRGPWAEHTINGGAGDDDIDASGGRGRMILDGGDGDDILQGGMGDDIIRGGAGDDRISGGWGNDELYGQDGNDRISGGFGHDFIHGGNGRDTLRGGAGMDAIYGDKTDWAIEAGRYFSAGRGIVDDGDSDIVVRNGRDLGQLSRGVNDVAVEYDRSDTEAWLEQNPRFMINGSDEFRDRTTADIGAILTSNQGRDLLQDLGRRLRDNGTILKIEEEFALDEQGSYDELTDTITVANHSNRYSADGSSRAPLPILFHELVHAHQCASPHRDRGYTRLANGAAYENVEFQAIGLEYFGVDGRRRSSNEYPYTDNKFRRELGLEERRAYGGVISPPIGSATPRGPK